MSTYELQGIREENGLLILTVLFRKSCGKGFLVSKDWSSDFVEHRFRWFCYPSMTSTDVDLDLWLGRKKREHKARSLWESSREKTKHQPPRRHQRPALASDLQASA